MTASRLLALVSAAAILAACNQPPAPPAPPPQTQSAAPPAAPAAATPPPAPAAKPRITKLDDLPRHTYPVQGAVIDLVLNDAKFNALADQVYANTEKGPRTITISRTRRCSRASRASLLADRPPAGPQRRRAQAPRRESRTSRTKPALKLTAGLLVLTRLDVEDKTGITDLTNPAFVQGLPGRVDEARAGVALSRRAGRTQGDQGRRPDSQPQPRPRRHPERT